MVSPQSCHRGPDTLEQQRGDEKETEKKDGRGQVKTGQKKKKNKNKRRNDYKRLTHRKEKHVRKVNLRGTEKRRRQRSTVDTTLVVNKRQMCQTKKERGQRRSKGQKVRTKVTDKKKRNSGERTC